MFEFLTFEEVLEIHEDSLRAYGGTSGLRDRGMVESALGYHLAESQAFLDGNKRTGIGAAIVFLHMNGEPHIPSAGDRQAMYDAMIAIAKHELDKSGLATLLREMFGK